MSWPRCSWRSALALWLVSMMVWSRPKSFFVPASDAGSRAPMLCFAKANPSRSYLRASSFDDAASKAAKRSFVRGISDDRGFTED
jgi:hypothetical protein